MDSNQGMAMMKGGQMVLMINREMLVMENTVVTPDGVQVNTDGTLLLPDGTTSKLAEGEALVIDLVLSQLVA
jgi:predicted RecA/RadA family phage recombinase